MKILIEGEAYPLLLLEGILEDASFYTQDNSKGTITTVGYYYSSEKKSLVYMLPKVFMRENGNTVFDIDVLELADIDSDVTFKHDEKHQWVRQLLVYFYNSLKEFKRRHNESILLHKSDQTLLNSNIPEQEYTYLDLLLTFVNFYKKNKNPILYRHIQSVSKTAKRTNWPKTIRKQQPLINSAGQPVYHQFLNKNKAVNSQEELLVYFFSILEHFNQEHGLSITIDKSYNLIKGKAFEMLKHNGLRKLRKIKYRYFSDIYKKMYRLCELYFAKNDLGAKSSLSQEFLTIDNYNIVFEDMVDKLFSDLIKDNTSLKDIEGLSLKKLKNHPDGKILDHIYSDKSLIDNSNIFYIGDSKYYKSVNNAGQSSKFKQFTYAKNVIQFNIDVLNQKSKLPNNLRYRDDITEGYNISPNFFIYGYIDNYRVFEDPLLAVKGNKPTKSAHFPERLFDRDTLFIREYKLNFLYVLKSYTSSDELSMQEFRNKTKKQFREQFIRFFNSPSDSEFFVIQEEFEDQISLKRYVDANFKGLNGRCISVGNTLLIAKPFRPPMEEDDINKQFIFQ
ncbi:hypothetical protein [uncultured Psychrobacter sp.]|uniref:hypothetical protein n=1 Tax=uncultured Psychrobacter sp. TaxID=259303 RepID=UPI002610D522|nr:hypothetical protein [uncultured Psychrobacter sp.]